MKDEKKNMEIKYKIMEITNEFIRYIQEGIPFSFSKFGDGEYMCVSNYPEANCDGDTYTPDLRKDLEKAFIQTVEQGGFIGQWWHDYIKRFWESKVENPNKIIWADYHSVIIDKNVDNKILLYKTIKESKYKKIYIHNYLLIKVKKLLNIDEEVIIDLRNWYRQKDKIKEEIKSKIPNNEKCIIMTSMGMGAKVIISELRQEYPENMYIDIGSALDLICTKKDSRGKCEYERHKGYFKELLPEDWEDPKYEYIYKEAKLKLGIHL